MPLLVACGPNGSAGELGNGVFQYSCTGVGDPACDYFDLTPPEVPESLAVGSTFAVDYEPREGADGTVEPASPELLSGSEAQFEAHAPGTVALLATANSTVVDLIHVRLAWVARVRIDERSGSSYAEQQDISEIALEVGEQALLRAVGVDEAGDSLAGHLPCDWSTSNSAIASFSGLAGDNTTTLTANGVGVTSALVELGAEPAVLDLVVTGDGGSGGEGGSP